MPASGTKPRPPPKIDLALQGGGSHGAFSWGVLDRLLEDDTLAFAGISGTSAGAINAAVMATGFARGGRAGAREALAAFWRDTSRSGSPFSPVEPGGAGAFAWDRLPGYQWVSSYLALVEPLRVQPAEPEPAEGSVASARGLRRAARRTDAPLHHRDERAQRPGARLHRAKT